MRKQDIVSFCLNQSDTWAKLGKACQGELYRNVAYGKSAHWQDAAFAVSRAEPFHAEPRFMVEGDL